MIDLDYDLQKFLRVVLRSRAWQRAAYEGEVAPHLPFHFAGPVLRRMSGEQAWDSLLTLSVPDVDAAVNKPKPDYTFYARIRAAKSTDEYWRLIEELIAAGQGHKQNFVSGLAMVGKVREVGFLKEDLVRASELSSPSPDGHFLRQFGQSDRDLIDNAWANPTTPQALTMLNGPLFDLIAGEDSVLGRQVKQGRSASLTPAEQVRLVYLAVLSREPTAAETQLVLEKLGAEGEQMWKPLAWSLLNTRQFLFVQ
jgi:hypothetical protein